MANPDETNTNYQICEKERKAINHKEHKEQPTAVMEYESGPRKKVAVSIGCLNNSSSLQDGGCCRKSVLLAVV